MPRTHGDSFLHVDRIAHMVPVDDPLPTRATEPLDEVDRAIGRNIAGLVPNGATLQTAARFRTRRSPRSTSTTTSASTPRCSPTA
jgi:hypothetical protein